MVLSQRRLFAGIGLLSVFISAISARTIFADVATADQVVQYTAGDAVPPTYWGGSYAGPGSGWSSGPTIGLPAAANNIADDQANGIYGDNSIITPFNAEFTPAKLVGLGGNGGYLEVHLSQPISTNGYTLGVHAGVGLNDISYPSGETGSFGAKGAILPAASSYTDVRSAEVLVSAVGGANPANWVALNNGNPIAFDAPTNYYTDLSNPYPASAGTVLADFAQPFLVNGSAGTLSNFDGNLDWQQTLAVLNGSAGGTWLDLSQTGLSEVNYVVFETTSGEEMFVDSVVGVVPEPATFGLLAVPFVLLISTRRRRS